MNTLTNNRRGEITIAIALCSLFAIIWLYLPHPAIAPVLSLVPIALLFVLAKPFLMVLLFVIFSFFRIHEVFPQLYSLKIPLLLSLASLFALTWHVILTKKIRPYWRPELTIVSVFFALVFIGVIIASNRSVALAYFSGIYWKIAIMTFAIAWLTRADKDFEFASRMITASGILVGLVAIANKINGIGMVEGTRVTIGRAIGSVLGDPNDLALVLMFPTSFALSLLLTPKLTLSSKILGWVSLPILFSAIIATQSRGGLLGMMAIFFVYGYRRVQSKALFFSVAITLASLLFLLAGISERSSGGAAEEGIDESAMGRIYAWQAAFGMALEHPLTGVGIDNFYYNYYIYSPHWDGLNHAVHSTWFGVLAETGFLGLAVFIGLIVKLIATSLKSLKKIEHSAGGISAPVYATAQAVLAGLIATVISGTFLTQGFTWPIYILAALVVAVAHHVDTQLSSSPPNTIITRLT